jgi:hypothetical protein
MAQLFEFQLSQLSRALQDTQHASAAGYLDLATVNLFQSPLVINEGLTVAACHAAVATYTGYAAVVITWATPSVARDGSVEVISQAITFRPTDAVTPNVIYGVFILDTTGDFLYFAGNFDNAPLPMQNADQLIRCTVRYRPATNSLILSFD